MDTELKTQAKGIQKRLSGFWKRWKYPLLVILVGLALVLWPGFKKADTATSPQPTVQQAAPILSYAEQTEQRLCEILSAIDGAGRVEVMLTVKGSDITFFQTDTDSSTEKSDETSRSSTQYKTVILSGSGEYDKAAVVKTEYPAFEGALIVSEGADLASVRLELVNAVSALLGLGADKISVVKMK